jgi:hypothetical protein
MRRWSNWLAGVTAGLLVLGAVARADEGSDKIPLDKVPAPVMKAFKAKYPTAKIVTAEKGDQDGKQVYEFAIEQGGKKLEVSFSPDAKFVGSEEVIKESDLPAKVRQAFQKKYPKAEVVEVEKAITAEGGSEKVVYEIIIKHEKGKLETRFDPEGKFLGQEVLKK